jgi:cyclophilin family peptidyl-prolyl cis-trans isomerase
MRSLQLTFTGAFVLLLAVGACGSSPSETPAASKDKPKEKSMVLLKTSMGDIKVELYPDKAPITVQNFLDYVKAGYYDGTVFHRVIPNFMIQGGGFGADLKEKPGQRASIKNESSNGLKNDTGTLAMARTSAPDSASSQFFINLKDNGFLNRESAADKVGYAVFGKVVEGMDVVRKIEKVQTTTKGSYENAPAEPVTIQSAKVVE